MTNFFRPSHHSTPLQQAVEKATDGSQPSEDWGSIMKICDYVCAHEESAKETMKIIRKRLQLNPLQHGWRTISYTLSLLEALTKNCGKIFHVQIAHKDFLKELKGVIGPKNSPPIAIQERVLGMIQTWALAFRHDPDLKTVEHFYQDCLQHGLRFPEAEPESTIRTSMPPTRTLDRPLQSVPSSHAQGYKPTSEQNRPASSTSSNSPVINSATSGAMSQEQLAKLRSELDIVQTNAQVFGEMLVTLQPAQENPQDFELLMELHNTCKQMQARVVELLSQVTIDDITVDLLRYNDELNNAFKAFENYMQERNRRCSVMQMPTFNRTTNLMSPSSTNNSHTASSNADNEAPLIKFDDEPIDNFQNLSINPMPSSVVPKPTQNQSRQSATTGAATRNNDPERDVKEIERWLKIQGDDSDNDEQVQQDGGTTTAFDNFLQKRASTIRDEPVAGQANGSYNQEPPKGYQKTDSYL